MSIPAATSSTWETVDDCRALVSAVLAKFGVELDFTLELRRGLRGYTLALTGYGGGAAFIHINAKHLPFMTQEERFQTVVHEACHLVDLSTNGPFTDDMHRESWRALMVACGLEPHAKVFNPRGWNLDRVKAVQPRRRLAWCCTKCSFALGMTSKMVGSKSLYVDDGECLACDEGRLYIRWL